MRLAWRVSRRTISRTIFSCPKIHCSTTPRRLKQIPGVIVQGRYDMVCPIISADDLHRAWPEAEYIVVSDAGHSAWEPGITAQLVAAMEKLKAGARL